MANGEREWVLRSQLVGFPWPASFDHLVVATVALVEEHDVAPFRIRHNHRQIVRVAFNCVAQLEPHVLERWAFPAGDQHAPGHPPEGRVGGLLHVGIDVQLSTLSLDALCCAGYQGTPAAPENQGLVGSSDHHVAALHWNVWARRRSHGSILRHSRGLKTPRRAAVVCVCVRRGAQLFDITAGALDPWHRRGGTRPVANRIWVHLGHRFCVLELWRWGFASARANAPTWQGKMIKSTEMI